jgi:ABC-type Mn2+/Zn2+ transport system ATPase subunit
LRETATEGESLDAIDAREIGDAAGGQRQRARSLERALTHERACFFLDPSHVGVRYGADIWWK